MSKGELILNNRRENKSMKQLIVAALLTLGVGHATADTWRVDYLTSTSIDQTHNFYGPGAYLFVYRPQYIPVYLQVNNNWNWLGMYGQPYDIYGQAQLPADLPPIHFPIGTDQAVAVPVSVPENGESALYLALGLLFLAVLAARRGVKLS